MFRQHFFTPIEVLPNIPTPRGVSRGKHSCLTRALTATPLIHSLGDRHESSLAIAHLPRLRFWRVGRFSAVNPILQLRRTHIVRRLRGQLHLLAADHHTERQQRVLLRAALEQQPRLRLLGSR